MAIKNRKSSSTIINLHTSDSFFYLQPYQKHNLKTYRTLNVFHFKIESRKFQYKHFFLIIEGKTQFRTNCVHYGNIMKQSVADLFKLPVNQYSDFQFFKKFQNTRVIKFVLRKFQRWRKKECYRKEHYLLDNCQNFSSIHHTKKIQCVL